MQTEQHGKQVIEAFRRISGPNVFERFARQAPRVLSAERRQQRNQQVGGAIGLGVAA